MPGYRPSKTQVAFFSVTGTLLGSWYWDRHWSDEYRQRQLRVCRHLIANQPMPVDQSPRKLTVYLSAVNVDDGHRLRRAFDFYVKPVFDAAALDYQVVEAWDWYRDIRLRIHEELGKKKEGVVGEGVAEGVRAEVERRIQEEGGDGLIAFGRPALKGVVAGMQDVLQENLVAKSPVARAAPEPSSSLPGKSTRDSRWFWQRWFGYPPKQNDALSPVESASMEAMEVHPHLEAMFSHELEPAFPFPPVGFIPYTIPRWFKRIYGFFNDRYQVKTIGDAAVTIALGGHVKMDSLFPGDIEFTIEKGEKRETDGKKEEEKEKEKSEEESTEAVKQEDTEVNDNGGGVDAQREKEPVDTDADGYHSKPSADHEKSAENWKPDVGDKLLVDEFYVGLIDFYYRTDSEAFQHQLQADAHLSETSDDS